LATISGTKTMIVEARFGSSSLTMIRTLDRPCARAASMNSRSRSPSTWPRIGLAT
jgi:hypothetical protein